MNPGFKLQGKSRIISKDQQVTVLNEGQIIEVQGKPVKRAVTSYVLNCNLQPLRGIELFLVPEGDRYKEQYWLFTDEVQQPLVVNQIVLVRKLKFQVQLVEQWGSYQRARIMRVDVGPNKN